VRPVTEAAPIPPEALARVVGAILPEGIEPPPTVPPDVFAAALARYMDCERIDVQQLAAQLGVSRRTVWRKTGGRDRLLGEVLWYRTRLALAESLVAAVGREGADRVVFVVDRVMRHVAGQASLRRLLDAEPEIALRILTSTDGPVQGGITAALTRLLEQEHERGMPLAMPAATLGYAIVRIAESFLYADVIGDKEPDIDAATEVVASLLRGQAVTS
jgi:AcrR family transcriptional regulator